MMKRFTPYCPGHSCGMTPDSQGNYCRLEDMPQWIPVAEKNPTETGNYIVVLRVGSMTVKETITKCRGVMTDHHGFRWMTGDWQEVIYWMYESDLLKLLPAPPENKS